VLARDHLLEKECSPMRNPMNHSAFSPDVNADDVVSWESNESVGHAWWACAFKKFFEDTFMQERRQTNVIATPFNNY